MMRHAISLLLNDVFYGLNVVKLSHIGMFREVAFPASIAVRCSKFASPEPAFYEKTIDVTAWHPLNFIIPLFPVKPVQAEWRSWFSA